MRTLTRWIPLNQDNGSISRKLLQFAAKFQDTPVQVVQAEPCKFLETLYFTQTEAVIGVVKMITKVHFTQTTVKII